MTWLRWVNLAVAILAGAASNLAGVLYLEFDPPTQWGAIAYIVLSWVTSALALAAWVPRLHALLWIGAAASLGWFVYMLSAAFILNIAGHFLAAVFFAATAWTSRPQATE